MQAFDRLAAAADTIERGVELRQVLEFHHQVVVAVRCRREPELAPCQPPALHLAARLEAVHIGREPLAELEVADAGLQVKPRVIDIHDISLRSIGPSWKLKKSIAQ